jgi:hypothetical protein
VNEIRRTPIVGEDYPRTWGQFEEWFASEDDCLRYLERLRASRSRGLLFYRLLEQAVITDPVTYGEVARKSRPTKRSRSRNAKLWS